MPEAARRLSSSALRSSAAARCMRAGISSENSSSSSSGILLESRQLLLTRQPGFAASLGERAHAADIGGALGDRDHAARIEQIEQMARLDALVVGRQRQRSGEQKLALGLGVAEVAQQHLGVGMLEI